MSSYLCTGRPHGITEDYVNIVGEIMYPKQTFGPYGYDAESGRVSISVFLLGACSSQIYSLFRIVQFPVEKMSSLGWLLCPLRKPTVIGKHTS